MAISFSLCAKGNYCLTATALGASGTHFLFYTIHVGMAIEKIISSFVISFGNDLYKM